MTRKTSPLPRGSVMTPAMLIAAVRCWREARDHGKSVQPRLFALLTQHGHDMLAPAIDSVMTLAESMAGRRIRTGDGPVLSDDEHRLMGLLEGKEVLPGKGGLAASFDCAVRSLRIMLKPAAA
jgi:hypothetical protein